MSAYDELLSTGQFGRAGLELLYRLMRSEARRFPVLGVVDEESVSDLVMGFFADRGGP